MGIVHPPCNAPIYFALRVTIFEAARHCLVHRCPTSTCRLLTIKEHLLLCSSVLSLSLLSLYWPIVHICSLVFVECVHTCSALCVCVAL